MSPPPPRRGTPVQDDLSARENGPRSRPYSRNVDHHPITSRNPRHVDRCWQARSTDLSEPIDIGHGKSLVPASVVSVETDPRLHHPGAHRPADRMFDGDVQIVHPDRLEHEKASQNDSDRCAKTQTPTSRRRRRNRTGGLRRRSHLSVFASLSSSVNNPVSPASGEKNAESRLGLGHERLSAWSRGGNVRRRAPRAPMSVERLHIKARPRSAQL